MPKKLNSFILSDNMIQKMRVKIEEGKKKDVEIGFNLCTKDNDLYAESDVIGNEYTIMLPEKCLKGEKVGTFHTHSDSPEPSMIDIYQAYNFGINCIGSIKKNKIVCYIRKDRICNKKNIKNIKSSVIKFERPACLIKNLSDRRDREIYERWINERDELIKRYLYKVVVN